MLNDFAHWSMSSWPRRGPAPGIADAATDDPEDDDDDADGDVADGDDVEDEDEDEDDDDEPKLDVKFPPSLQAVRAMMGSQAAQNDRIELLRRGNGARAVPTGGCGLGAREP